MTKYPKTSIFRLNSAKKTIWLFGAGASAGEPYNVPSQENLLKHFFTMTVPGRAAFQDEFNRLRDDIKELCERVQPGLSPEEAILEEVFSAYEIEAQSPYSSYEQTKFALEAVDKLRKRSVMLLRFTAMGKHQSGIHTRETMLQLHMRSCSKNCFPLAVALIRLRATHSSR